MKDKIMEMIQNINEYEEFDEDTDLFENDILDSLTLVMLINEMEESFGIFIPEEIVSVKNFSSVNAMVSVIESLKK